MALSRPMQRLVLLLSGTCFFIAFAPYLSPNDPTTTILSARLQGASLQYPLGTDHMGRCVLSRLLFGLHVTPVAAFVIVVISASIGSIIGLLSGYFGGFVDLIVMRFVEGVFVFPAIAIALTISATLGLGMNTMIIALGAVHWAEYARTIRNAAVVQKERTYVLGAKSIGTSRLRIIFRHIFPNVSGIIFVLVPVSMSWAILSFSGMSYLGLGAAPGTPEWGLMIAEGRIYMRDHPRLVIAPGLSIIGVVLVLNLIGDTIQGHLNHN